MICYRLSISYVLKTFFLSSILIYDRLISVTISVT